MVVSAADRLEPFTVDDTLSLTERAYRRLRDSIADGTLPAGSRISERSLAGALGISAQPVREALRRLEAEGIVLTLPRRGTVVAEFGPERLVELGRLRTALEGAAAALAAQRATPEDLTKLEACLGVMRSATERGDTEALAEANERFHALLHAATGSIFLARSLATLWAFGHVGRLRTLRSSPQEPGRALREHAGVLDAMRQRDPDLAESRMREHVRRSQLESGMFRDLTQPGGPQPAMAASPARDAAGGPGQGPGQEQGQRRGVEGRMREEA